MHHKKRPPKVYVHYGNDTFIPSHVCQPQRWDKPSGLWASPVNAGWGWKDYVYREYKDRIPTLTTSFRFHLKKGTKILKVKTIQDIFPYLKEAEDCYSPWDFQLDHTKLRKEYDGMELFYSGKYNFHDTRLFWSWDCDSLVLWNTNMVSVIEYEYDKNALPAEEVHYVRHESGQESQRKGDSPQKQGDDIC